MVVIYNLQEGAEERADDNNNNDTVVLEWACRSCLLVLSTTVHILLHDRRCVKTADQCRRSVKYFVVRHFSFLKYLVVAFIP